MSSQPYEDSSSKTDAETWYRVILDIFRSGKEPASWPEKGPEDAKWRDLAHEIMAVRSFMLQLTKGDLSAELNIKGQLAGSMKSFQANLRHLAWQVEQVAAGDLSQRVDFMGDFSNAFNQMIDNLRTAQTDLQASEARYRLLAENAADVIWTMDLAGHFTYFSPSVERLCGYTVEEAIQLRIDQSFTPASAQLIQQLLSGLQSNSSESEPPQIGSFELEQICRNGSTIWIEVSTNRLYTPDGELIGIQGASRDITERRRAQQAEIAQRALAEGLRDTAAALNSAHTLDEVLEILLSQINRLLPHDTIEVLLIDSAETAHIAASKGYEITNPGFEGNVAELRFPIHQIANLELMATTGEPCLIDSLEDFTWMRSDSSSWAKSHLGVPILVKGKAVGFIVLLSRKLGFFTLEHQERLRTFADLAAVAIEKARLFEQLNEMATIDALTEIPNRRHFFNMAETELARAIRYNHPLAALMVDIDHFKRVNDTFGHSAGDQVLHRVAQCCQGIIRTNDLIGRYGGEEFCFLMPETGKTEAVNMAERLRAAVAQEQFPVQSGSIQVTISIGVAEFRPNIPTARALLDLADQALYLAKQNGRNRVVMLE